MLFQAVRSKDTVHCKCHGIATACRIRSCWKTLPSFQTVSQLLKEKHDSAILVKLKKRQQRLKPKLTNYALTLNDLVYSHRSKTTFCNKNLRLGSYGTQDRICNSTSPYTDNCEIMCCGRPIRTRQIMKKNDCQCNLPGFCREAYPQLCSELVSESRCL